LYCFKVVNPLSQCVVQRYYNKILLCFATKTAKKVTINIELYLKKHKNGKILQKALQNLPVFLSFCILYNNSEVKKFAYHA